MCGLGVGKRQYFQVALLSLHVFITSSGIKSVNQTFWIEVPFVHEMCNLFRWRSCLCISASQSLGQEIVTKNFGLRSHLFKRSAISSSGTLGHVALHHRLGPMTLEKLCGLRSHCLGAISAKDIEKEMARCSPS